MTDLTKLTDDELRVVWKDRIDTAEEINQVLGFAPDEVAEVIVGRMHQVRDESLRRLDDLTALVHRLEGR